MPFWTYILHCRGGVFYTGHTDDLEKRIAEHQSGLVCGFTSQYLPAELVWSDEFGTRNEALIAERRIKGWSRAKKLALIRGDWNEISRLAKGKSRPSEAKLSRNHTGSGQSDLIIARAAFQAILDHANEDEPQEACGLLLGEEGRITEARRVANVAADRARHFEIDPQALIDAYRAQRSGGPRLLGYYHSHPGGVAQPSATDREMAPGDGKVWAIVGQGRVAFWRDGESGFTPLSYGVSDG